MEKTGPDTKFIISSSFFLKWLAKTIEEMLVPEEDERRYQTVEIKISNGYIYLNEKRCGSVESKSREWVSQVDVSHIDRLIKVLKHVPDQPITVAISSDRWIDLHVQI